MNDRKKLPDLKIEGARIIYRNFSGRESQYNAKGVKNFCVVISDPEEVDRLADMGWNIKTRPARDENEDDLHYLPVAVRFDRIPPSITVVTRKNRVRLDEETVEELDFTAIRYVDVILNASNYTVRGTSGVKAYLKTMFVVVKEDALADKYEDFDYDELDEMD